MAKCDELVGGKIIQASVVISQCLHKILPSAVSFLEKGMKNHIAKKKKAIILRLTFRKVTV